MGSDLVSLILKKKRPLLVSLILRHQVQTCFGDAPCAILAPGLSEELLVVISRWRFFGRAATSFETAASIQPTSRHLAFTSS